MDANGIGTDATMAEHIAKIKERSYVETRSRSGRANAIDDADTSNAAARGGRGGRGGRGRGRGASTTTAGRPGTASNSTMQEFIPTTLGVAL
ncbi:DNA topoisomerase, partial [Cryomyces antarcticus]